MKRVVVVVALLCVAMVPARADAPIKGAGQWVRVDNPAGCWAAVNSAEVNVRLLRARDGGMIVAAGRSDWKHEGPVDVGLRVDNGRREGLKGTALMNLVLVAVHDEELVDSLRRASTLLWDLPWGKFRARVKGLGKAFDALAKCDSGR